MSEATLYAILGSHACRTGELMLEHKRVPYRRVNLPTGSHAVAVRLLGFPGRGSPRMFGGAPPSIGVRMGDRLGTVPAVRIGEQRWQTNRRIARELDRLEPERPLFPSDPALRSEVEEAERWGDEVFQMVARRTALASVVHGPDAMVDRANRGPLGPLLWRSETMRFVGMPPMLDRIDAWISAGVLNSDDLNAADFMIVTSLALLAYRRDLHDDIHSRPLGELVERVLQAPVAV